MHQARGVQGSITTSQAQNARDLQRPTSLKLSNHSAHLPTSPFTTAPMVKPQLGIKEDVDATAVNLHDNSPYTPSNQSKHPWAESPRQSYSEGENLAAQVRRHGKCQVLPRNRFVSLFHRDCAVR